jgi:hypothetical protein
MQSDMDLKTFVKTTITQIIEGVDEAIAALPKNSSARINPALSHANYSKPENVEFDVAITVVDSSQKGGSLGIKVLSAAGELKSETESASRIKFCVPVSVPCMPSNQYPPDQSPFRGPN